MTALVTIPAHFDGKSIVLDTSFSLQQNDKLLITVLSSGNTGDERSEWVNASLSQLGGVYNEDEPEYSLSQIREPNPEYKNERR